MGFDVSVCGPDSGLNVLKPLGKIHNDRALISLTLGNIDIGSIFAAPLEWEPFLVSRELYVEIYRCPKHVLPDRMRHS